MAIDGIRNQSETKLELMLPIDRFNGRTVSPPLEFGQWPVVGPGGSPRLPDVRERENDHMSPCIAALIQAKIKSNSISRKDMWYLDVMF